MKYLALAVAILAGIMLFFWGSSGPAVSLTPNSGPVGGGRELAVKLEGPRGVKKLTVAALQGEKKVELLVKEYPSGVKSARETFTLARAGLKDGPLTLRVGAAGYSLFHIGGRTVDATHAFTYDATPPTVAVLSAAHNIILGGAGLVVYTVSKEVERTGVVAADRFYPGYRQKGNVYACLFPFPFDLEPARFVPRVIAVDRAGNERLVGITYHLLVKPFSTDTIELSDKLLEKVGA